jgi:glycerol-3-phosphate acyltransferase PlsX
MAITIALDAMGGDRAPGAVVDGAARVAEGAPELRFLIAGDAERVEPLVARHPRLAERSELLHTPESIAPDAKPSAALRQGRNSSMRLAIDAVKAGEANAAVSAGNTGALMALAKFVLKTLPGIDRPAIASVLPATKPVVVLDLGANAECDANNLVQFAIMGEVYARAVLGVARPSIGLLNIGTEELKGDDMVRAAAAALRQSPLDIEFGGFVEGHDILRGTVDVVVTDGFTGNVALKVAEGTVGMLGASLRQAFASSWRARLGYLLAKPALGAVQRRLDPRRHNGAMFLGLNGIVVKSHGVADGMSFANAIRVAANLVGQGSNDKITSELARVVHVDPEPRLAVS